MPDTAPHPLRVTPDNFIRAETDMYFANAVKDGGFGKFEHKRDLTPLNHQIVIRMNRDTLYSSAVFDLDAGPVTITLPDAGKRFMSMMMVDEDHYVHEVVYDSKPHTYSRDQIGTRYLLAALRTLVNPTLPGDLEAVHRLQDAVQVSQPATGRFETPQWDSESRTLVRDALEKLGVTLPDSHHSFGMKDEVDPVRHLIATAVGWGGNPEKDAYYVMGAPKQNDGNTPYVLTVKDVPVDGFWSVTVYNEKGFFEPNATGVYSINNLTARPDPDGSITVRFGGDPSAPNCIPIMKGWNYAVRMYRPRPEVLNGQWVFPEAVAVH